MECKLQAGDEVVCINRDGLTNLNALPVPTLNGVYKVEQLSPSKNPIFAMAPGFEIGVALSEFPLHPASNKPMFFPHCWFRKVEKPRTEASLELLRKIDADVFRKVDA